MSTRTLSNIVFIVGLSRAFALTIVFVHCAAEWMGAGYGDLNIAYAIAGLVASVALRIIERALLKMYRRRWLEFGVTDEYLNQRAEAYKIA